MKLPPGLVQQLATSRTCIETAIGGKNVTFTVEGRERYPVRVRYARDFREDIEGLRNVLVSGSRRLSNPSW